MRGRAGARNSTAGRGATRASHKPDESDERDKPVEAADVCHQADDHDDHDDHHASFERVDADHDNDDELERNAVSLIVQRCRTC